MCVCVRERETERERTLYTDTCIFASVKDRLLLFSSCSKFYHVAQMDATDFKQLLLEYLSKYCTDYIFFRLVFFHLSFQISSGKPVVHLCDLNFG